MGRKKIQRRQQADSERETSFDRGLRYTRKGRSWMQQLGKARAERRSLTQLLVTAGRKRDPCPTKIHRLMPWGQGRWKGGQPNLAEGGTDTGPADAAQGPAAGEQCPVPHRCPATTALVLGKPIKICQETFLTSSRAPKIFGNLFTSWRDALILPNNTAVSLKSYLQIGQTLRSFSRLAEVESVFLSMKCTSPTFMKHDFN